MSRTRERRGKPRICPDDECMLARLMNYAVDENGCHVWAGYVDRNGYGRVYDPDRSAVYWVHVVSYEVYKGPVAVGHEVDHTCQNTLCMRPDHLDSVTKAEHCRRTWQRRGKDDLHGLAAEMRRTGLTYAEIGAALGLSGREAAAGMVKAAIRKGLVDADDIPPARRLTPDERDDIHDLYILGIPQPILAECYGVDSSHVSRICSGQTSGWSAAKPPSLRKEIS